MLNHAENFMLTHISINPSHLLFCTTFSEQTTLAHIVARHCGYNAIEINASDDRSPEKLRDSIYNATQNTTLLTTVSTSGGASGVSGGISNGTGGNGHTLSTHTNTSTTTTTHKPNLIILDEIDGIDGSRNSLDVLTNIIKHPLHNNNKTKKAGVFALTRPLICICNDQYAPALRDLVRLADVFVFSGESLCLCLITLAVKCCFFIGTFKFVCLGVLVGPTFFAF